MSATGKCLCGSVTYSVSSVNHEFHSCHCGMCRRWGGGPAMATQVDGVQFEGADHIQRYQSSDWAERGFCRQCGTNLFYYLKPQDQYMMWVGTFDDQSQFRLVGEIYIDAKPDGYQFSGDHPKQTEAEFLASIGMA